MNALAGWLPAVIVAPSGLEARLKLEREAGDAGELPPPPTVDALREALARAGVRHGIDEAALAALAGAPEGRARVVARGEAPRRGADGVVVVDVAAALERDPLHTVAAGTPLARKTPPRPGEPGRSVTGEPIPAPAVRNPPLVAGRGATAVPGEGGTTVVVAAVDGRPAQRGGIIGVERLITLAELGPERTDLAVRCSLRLLEGISEAHRVRVTGQLTVGGTVDRSLLDADGGIVAGAGCVGSRLRAGGLGPVRRALAGRLGPIGEQLAALGREAGRLVAAARERGAPVRVGQAVYALSRSHFAGLVPALGEALEIARGPAAEGLPEETGRAIAAAHAALAGLEAHRIVTLDRLEVLAAALAREADAMRAAADEPADVRVGYLQRCRVEASGSLIVTGRGVFNCEVRVSGDLVCQHPRGTVRGGRLFVGGAVRVAELGAPGGAPVEVILEGGDPVPERLVAAVVHEGVRVRLGEQLHAFGERRRNVRLGLGDDGTILLR